MMQLREMIDVPGVKSGRLKSADVSSVTAAMHALREHRSITSADDEGAILVWRDDDGKYRCERMRYRATMASACVATKKEVAAWLKQEFPRIRR